MQIIIHFQQTSTMLTHETVSTVKDFINRVPSNEKVCGVFIDLPGQQIKLLDILNSNLETIDVIYTNFQIHKDDFLQQLINELQRSNNFQIKNVSVL